MNRAMQVLFDETTTSEYIERSQSALRYEREYGEAFNKLVGDEFNTEKEEMLSNLSIRARMVGFEAGFNMAMELYMNR